MYVYVYEYNVKYVSELGIVFDIKLSSERCNAIKQRVLVIVCMYVCILWVCMYVLVY